MDERDYKACYPLFLDVRGKRVVVVGAGVVAERKVLGLLPYGSKLVVVAPVATTVIRDLDVRGRLVWHERTFEPGDLDGALLAFAATGIDSVNRQVVRAGHDRDVLVNVVDEPTSCDFFVPSVVRRGPFQCAISTSGLAPGLSARVRRELEECYPNTWGEYVTLVGEVRALIRQRHPHDAARRRELIEQLYGMDVYERLARGESIEASCLLEMVELASEGGEAST
jgi:precorrin-2 dehydrogenase/sirohydrochlorin ferrochelatase